MIRRRIRFSGPREIQRHRIAARAARATISTAIPCWRSNADTGKMNWYFQFTKHDEHDWDATQVPVMIDSMTQAASI